MNLDERDERSMYRGRRVTEGAGDTNPIATAVREEDATWMARGSCRGMNPSVFFPSDGAGFEAAQRICMECPVRVECLEYALANRIEQGAWGGTSERERRRILRRRRALKLENEFVLARSNPATPQQQHLGET
jgi:WhiB family redox-sensing transcriptional regulator